MSEAVAGAEELRRFRPHPEYKDSGVEWLGDIPVHWAVKPVKFLASTDNSGVWGNEPDECESPLPVATTAHIDPDGSLLVDEMPRRCLSTSEGRYYQCRVGDIVVVKSSGSATNVISGKAGLVGENEAGMVFSNFLLRLRPFTDTIDPRILFRFLTSGIVKERIRVMVSTTTYPNLRVGEYLRFEVPLAPLAEQQAIAEFLDRETGKIDALVAKKERLIELLQEKRTALITHAVTKGLDPTAPTKPSGVGWLGDIPAHWEVKRWRYSCRISEGQVDPKDEEFGDRVLIAPNHIESGTGRILYLETAYEQGAISGKYVVRSGSLIYSKIRPALNKLCIAEGEWLCSADMYPIKTTNTDLSVQYLKYFMLSDPFVRLMVDESMRVAMPKVNRETLSATFVLCPPIENQSEIVEVLDTKTAALDALISMVRAAVDHFRELRTALISAAVTGKIDVREVVE